MSIYLRGILVVEGKEDAAYLSNYIDSEIVVVNGFEMNQATISYLQDKEVLLLLDPDDSGKRIRSYLKKLLPHSIDVEIDIDKCDRGTKKGVAECQIDEILSKLHKYVIEKTDSSSDIKQSDLYKLGLLSDNNLRKSVCGKLKLGECNGKTFYKRLLNNNISLKQLCEIMK